MISLTDTGMGMPSQVVERAFEPFFTTRESESALGSGLARSAALTLALDVYSRMITGFLTMGSNRNLPPDFDNAIGR